MQNIVIVTEVKNFLLMSTKERLENASYQVVIVPAETNAINEIKDSISGLLIHAEENLTKKQQGLNFIKDRAITDDIPIFAIGESDDLQAVKVIIPKHLIRREFSRPVNVTALVEEVDNFIKQFSMQIKRKILVVDDSGAMLRVVKGWLEDKYNVFLANSGAMAIKYLALNRPDLVLLDYEMPIVDGKQVLEMIRSEMDFADIPVIFLTGKESKENIMAVKDLKPEGYLLKSMAPSQIVKDIDDFFEKTKGSR